ncbi:Ankyrin repeat domain containing protein [Pandoravirus salinus]|uniref:Ankyrin repeat domain containing protein n=1 Tax=Pandoravirus salinus TaxID=1349410 RepID=S4VX26_9VIRU|nr:ankyrin repeat domain [Pandoravirus salinus]AGO85224.2 Ankyrin repeat domain containing protein [Pandoravirus salinus]
MQQTDEPICDPIDDTMTTDPIQPAAIARLPDEVLAHILRWLPCAERTAAAQVDRRWRTLAEDARLLGLPRCVFDLADEGEIATFRATLSADVDGGNGKTARCTYIHASHCPCHQNRLVDAAVDGRHDLIEPIVRGCAPKYKAACLVAASRGHHRVVAALLRANRSAFPDYNVAECAARAGHNKVIERVVNFSKSTTWPLCKWAARAGQLDTLIYLREHGAPWDSRTFKAAAKSGRLDLFCYMHENACRHDCSVMRAAAAGGHAHIVDYGLANGFKWKGHWCDRVAALGNHLDVLLVARTHGYAWTPDVCSGAAAGGHLDLIKRAHADRSPWDGHTCSEAARRGRLDILSFAVENGCPMGEYTAWSACEGGHLDCLVYAHQHGAALTNYICWIAARHGHRDCMDYVHAQGFCQRSCRDFFPPPKGALSGVVSAASTVGSAATFAACLGLVCAVEIVSLFRPRRPW